MQDAVDYSEGNRFRNKEAITLKVCNAEPRFHLAGEECHNILHVDVHTEESVISLCPI